MDKQAAYKQNFLCIEIRIEKQYFQAKTVRKLNLHVFPGKEISVLMG